MNGFHPARGGRRLAWRGRCERVSYARSGAPIDTPADVGLVQVPGSYALIRQGACGRGLAAGCAM